MVVTIHQASLVPSSFKSFIFNLNIRLCWSMKILPTGNSEIMYCNTNDYIWETNPGMCSLKKWILKENKNIVQPVRWWKTAGCIFEMGIELLRTAWVQGNEKKSDSIIIPCMITVERLLKLQAVLTSKNRAWNLTDERCFSYYFYIYLLI